MFGTDVAYCGEYLELTLKTTGITLSISVFLSTFNYIIRTIAIIMITWVGYNTQTKVLERVTYVTFVCQFFNTSFLLLLMNADLSEQPGSTDFFWGELPDFNSQWFRTISNTLMETMIFNAIYPILEFLGYWALRYWSRCTDRPCCSYNKYETKKRSINAYIDIYVGPIYAMHYKYSTMLNVAFVTMMFGFGIPLLFPLAVFALWFLYLVERTMLYYSYQMPPMYNEKLNNSVLTSMRAAPLYFFAFGYWMASSNQLLKNDHLTPIAT